jgi:dipeptidyl-peptidase-4
MGSGSVLLLTLLSQAVLAPGQSSPAAKKPVTLDAAAAAAAPAPFSSVWASDGRRFAIVEEGKLRIYDLPSRSEAEVAALSAFEQADRPPAPERFAFENRNLRQAAVQWFPSGRELLISAGGGLFLFRPGAAGWTRLTSTHGAERDPKVSPNGRSVSFRREHDLYSLEIATAKEVRLTRDGSPTLLNGEVDWVYPEELDLGTAHWWSPDSESIAYLQFDVSREPVYPHVDLFGPRAALEPQRYPQAGTPNADVRLGVVPARGGRTVWMDLGQTRDHLYPRVWWLPDSKGIAVLRTNRVQNRLDLLVADPVTGRSRVVLQETDPFWINVREDLRFLKGGKEFIWASERDGFNHLYRYAIDGRELGRITSGEWEVAGIAEVDEGSGSVYYVSTESGPLERQLWRAGLDGGGRKRITRAPGTHAISMGPDCRYYLDSHSSLTSPPRKTVHTGDGAEWAIYREADRRPLDEYRMMPSEIIEVKASDGTTLYGRLVKPEGFEQGKKYPLVVNVYGGPHAQTVRDAWPGVLNLEQVLAQRGYLVWALDNRGSFGRGHKFEAAVFRDLGRKEVEDQKAGVGRLVELGLADPRRVAIRGWSYGGYMTLHALLLAPEVFRCGVAGAPVTDWRNYDTIYTERYMGLPADNPDGYRNASNLEHAADLKGRLLIAHNLEDDNVLFENTARMADALERAGKLFELMIYPNKAHGLASGRKHFMELEADFLERNLR